MSDAKWQCVGPVNVWQATLWGDLVGTVALYPRRTIWSWDLGPGDSNDIYFTGNASTFEDAKRDCEEAAIQYMVDQGPADPEAL